VIHDRLNELDKILGIVIPDGGIHLQNLEGGESGELENSIWTLLEFE
jgi:hypothetical protein